MVFLPFSLMLYIVLCFVCNCLFVASNLEKIGVGFSGGPDSLALLIMLRKVFDKERVVAITVDHDLPGFTKEPIDKIAALAKRLGTHII